MRLDLDGILEVTAVEKQTGKSKHVTIANALRAKTAEQIAAAKRRIQELYEMRSEEMDEWDRGEVDEGDENEEAACDETDRAVPCAAESAAEPQWNSSNGEGDRCLACCSSAPVDCSIRCIQTIARKQSSCTTRSRWQSLHLMTLRRASEHRGTFARGTALLHRRPALKCPVCSPGLQRQTHDRLQGAPQREQTRAPRNRAIVDPNGYVLLVFAQRIE
jgi:hypothetical protein